MESHKISNPISHVPRLSARSGFTLIEVMVVFGILSLIFGMTFFVDVNSYRVDAFRAEVSTIGGALEAARANALNNIDEAKHGVAINPPGYKGYVIFEGNSYATRKSIYDIATDASYGVDISPMSPSEVVFDQLSGNSVDATITFTDPSRAISTALEINHEGRISF